MLVNPSAAVDVARGLLRYLKAKRIASPAELRGRLRVRSDRPAPQGVP
jgi:hypothetical protein